MRFALFSCLFATAFAQAVLNNPIGLSAANVASGRDGLDHALLQSPASATDLRKRMDPNHRDWEMLNRYFNGPDPNLSKDTDQDVLRQRYGHLIHHNDMPVFAAQDVRREERLMNQAFADFGAVQVYGSPSQNSRNPHHSFRVHMLVPTDGTYSYRYVDDEERLLDKLDYAHHLESRFGPHIKLATMGLPLDTRGNGRFGGHSANRVWEATPERLSDYSARTLRDKLNRDRFGLFLSHDGQHLLAITIGNNGLAQVKERVSSIAPVFEAGSRRFY